MTKAKCFQKQGDRRAEANAQFCVLTAKAGFPAGWAIHRCNSCMSAAAVREAINKTKVTARAVSYTHLTLPTICSV